MTGPEALAHAAAHGIALHGRNVWVVHLGRLGELAAGVAEGGPHDRRMFAIRATEAILGAALGLTGNNPAARLVIAHPGRRLEIVGPPGVWWETGGPPGPEADLAQELLG